MLFLKLQQIEVTYHSPIVLKYLLCIFIAVVLLFSMKSVYMYV